MSFSAQLYHLGMEKEGFWGLNWQSADAKPPPELNSGSATVADQLPPCLLNLNWKQQMSHDGDLESAISSLVSSPSSHPAAAAAAADGAVIGELIGRLGGICNSGEISPSSRHRSANTSCHSTPLNSHPKLNLSAVDHRQQGRGGLPFAGHPMPGAHFVPLSADPWFAEGAARLSRCGGLSSPGFAGQFGFPETPENLSRASSSKSLMAGTGSRMGAPENGNEVGMLDPAQLEMEIRSQFGGPSTPEDSELGNGPEESSVSDRMTAEASSLRGIPDGNATKRKAAAKAKRKETPLSYSLTNPTNMTEEENSNAKRCKPAETNSGGKDAEFKTKTDLNRDRCQKQGKDSEAKPPEPPKDYIHVRARRGQATDTHSLSERVRREKISKRMKFLQDLVPGCNKVTGKAVMLDEIINYVQSLQRQVEFLSMKLATVNPQLDNMENLLLPKDMYEARGQMPQPIYPADMMTATFSYPLQPQAMVTSGLEAQFSLNPLESSLRQSMQLAPLDGFTDASSQLGHFWEDDLQSVSQVGFGQNQDSAFSSQSFGGQMHASHMKIEL